MAKRLSDDQFLKEFAAAVRGADSWDAVQDLIWRATHGSHLVRRVVFEHARTIDDAYLSSNLDQRLTVDLVVASPALTALQRSRVLRWAVGHLRESPHKDVHSYAATLLEAALKAGWSPAALGVDVVGDLIRLGAPPRQLLKTTERHREAARVLLASPTLPPGTLPRLVRQYPVEQSLYDGIIGHPESGSAEWGLMAAPPDGGWSVWRGLEQVDVDHRSARLKKLAEHPGPRRDPATRSALLHWLAIAPDEGLLVHFVADGLSDARPLFLALGEVSMEAAGKALVEGGDVLAARLTHDDLLPFLQSPVQAVRLAAVTSAGAVGHGTEPALSPLSAGADAYARARALSEFSALREAEVKNGVATTFIARPRAMIQSAVELLDTASDAVGRAATLEEAERALESFDSRTNPASAQTLAHAKWALATSRLAARVSDAVAPAAQGPVTDRHPTRKGRWGAQ